MSLARPPFWSDVFFATTLREPRSATVACSPKVLCALRGTDPHALAASERSDVLRMLLSSATHSDPDGARMLERGAGMLAAGGGVSLREAGMMLPVCGADGGPQLYAACSGEGVGGVTAVLLGVFDALDRPKLRPLLDGCVAAAVLCGSASAAARDAATYGLTALLRISPSPDLSAGLVAALAALAQPRPGQCPFGAHLVLKACSSGRVADAAAAWRSYAAAIGVRGAAAAADPSALPDSAAVTLHRLSAPPPVRWAQARRAGSAEPESLVALAAIAATQLHKDGPPLAFHTEQACEAVWKCVEEADCGAATPQALYALLEAVRCSAATRDAVWDTDQSCADVGGLGAAVTGLLQSAAAASVHSAAALFALGAADDIAPLLLPPPARPRHADPAAAPDRGAGLAALRLLAPDRAAGLHLLLSSAPQPFPAPPPLSGASVARRLRAGARCCSALLQPLLAAGDRAKGQLRARALLCHWAGWPPLLAAAADYAPAVRQQCVEALEAVAAADVSAFVDFARAAVGGGRPPAQLLRLVLAAASAALREGRETLVAAAAHLMADRDCRGAAQAAAPEHIEDICDAALQKGASRWAAQLRRLCDSE